MQQAPAIALDLDKDLDGDLDHFIAQAWQQHAEQPQAVAGALAALPLARLDAETHVLKLSHLGQHVLGEHLGRWDEAVAWQQRLAALPACGEAGQAATRRCMAALRLAAGDTNGRGAVHDSSPLAGLAPSERVRAVALAASSLVAHDAARASAWLQQATAQFEAAGLAAADPAARALAVTGNNLACELETKPDRSPTETALMLQAAQAARRFWALAGGWLETERAEYRLAMSWLQAGDAAQALQHAERCLALVDAQPPTPALALERFFGFEAMARAASRLQRGDVLADSRARAQAAFQALAAEDQAWCQATCEQLSGLPG